MCFFRVRQEATRKPLDEANPQWQKRRFRPGRDSNQHSDNARTSHIKYCDLPYSILVLSRPCMFFPKVGRCWACPVNSNPSGPSAFSPASVLENWAPSPQGAVLMYRWKVTPGLTLNWPGEVSLRIVFSGFCLNSANWLYRYLCVNS